VTPQQMERIFPLLQFMEQKTIKAKQTSGQQNQRNASLIISYIHFTRFSFKWSDPCAMKYLPHFHRYYINKKS
jgi:hypothetical protein